MTRLAELKTKLATYPLLSLTGEELEFYFLRRLDSLLRAKGILVRRELEYLLGETGPGLRRIDPEIFALLTNDELFTDTDTAHSSKDVEMVVSRKAKLQKLISGDLRSSQNASLIQVLLNHYFDSLEIRSSTPLIFSGSFEEIPVHILFENGGWVMPDDKLFDVLREARESKCLAVVIAKKIHGILFPLFKSLGVVGANTYETYVSRKADRECHKLESDFGYPKRTHLLPWPISYSERVQDLQELSRAIPGDEYEGDMLKQFLEGTLPRVAPEAYSTLLKSTVDLNGTFRDIALRLKGKKLKKGLCDWIKKREALIADIKNLKSKKDGNSLLQ